MSTDPNVRRRPVAPELLGRDVAYYREQAAQAALTLGSLSESQRADEDIVTRLERRRQLWHQLADELDEYLTAAPDDGPGLF